MIFNTNFENLDEARNTINFIGRNLLSSSDEDTPQFWIEKGMGVAYFSNNNTLIVDQPSATGVLLNMVNPLGSVRQLWFVMTNGDVYHRGGNTAGWSGTWKKFVDSTNSAQTPLTINAVMYGNAEVAGGLGVFNAVTTSWGPVSLPTTYCSSGNLFSRFDSGEPLVCQRKGTVLLIGQVSVSSLSSGDTVSCCLTKNGVIHAISHANSGGSTSAFLINQKMINVAPGDSIGLMVRNDKASRGEVLLDNKTSLTAIYLSFE